MSREKEAQPTVDKAAEVKPGDRGKTMAEGSEAAGHDCDEAEGTRVQPNGNISHDGNTIDHDS